MKAGESWRAPKIPPPRWHPLLVNGQLSPSLRDKAHGASGAYAIRSKRTHAVKYVGESSRGNLWRTLLRHFQAPDSFLAQRETGVFTGDASGYEVAIHVTSRGPRPRAPAKGSQDSVRLRTLKRQGRRFTTKADQRAMVVQARWIANFRAAGHSLKNVDDGLADDGPRESECPTCHGAGEDLIGDRCETCKGSGRVVVDNPPAVPPTNVPAEKRAENRTPDLWTGRTKLEEGGKASRRDWKGDAERLARELAECRRAEGDNARGRESPPPPREVKRPDGYGATDAKGQASMFKRNPALVPKGRLVELGILTGLDDLAWSLRDAPVLAYDEAARLFIVYPGKILRASTKDELREYARTHWGAKGRGDCRGGVIATGPFDALGPGHVIQYTTRKGSDRELVDYVHEWGEGGRGKCTPPTIVRHDCGRPRCAWHGALALAGGSYKVSERGIVG